MENFFLRDNDLVEYLYEDNHILLELEDKKLFFYSSIADQVFTTSVTDLCDQKQVISNYPDYNSIINASQLYTKGITNKDKFLAIANNIYQNKYITLEELVGLQNFISQATCPPIKILEKTFMVKYQKYFPLMSFAENHPSLIFCAKALEFFTQSLYNS